MSTLLDDLLATPSARRPISPAEAASSHTRLRRESATLQPTDQAVSPEGTESLRLARETKPVRSHEDPFGVTLWCTGTVKGVDDEKGVFRADLVDDKGNRSSAEIDLEDIDPAERQYVVLGNRFTYVVYHERRASGLRNADEIVMEPTRVWTAEDVERSKKGLTEDLSFLDADD